MKPRKLLVLGALLASSCSAFALNALVAIEPSSRQDGVLVNRGVLEAGLGKELGRAVKVASSDDMADVMRATRSGEHDLYIAPAQVAASALMRGYELLGSTDPVEEYVLVGRSSVASAEALKGRRLYLPQQDSIYVYMARGMLTARGLSLRELGHVQYSRFPQAGLVALTMGTTDATVVRRSDWEQWDRQNPGAARVLATSIGVPGGFTVVVKKGLPAEERAKVAKWFASSAPSAGLRPVSAQADLAKYKAVAELGLFTPESLPGVKRVGAAEVRELLQQGAVMVDTRTEKEYKAARIPNAVFVPYGEKSLKDVAFDASQDDFAGLDKLDKARPTVFACNGAECWKSYKASKVATDRGFRQVYWFRGGLPEWTAAGLPVEQPQ